ncbi:MAG TPA: FHA domain-containing protein [Leptolyngbyaceae cyanobacterium M33_DOE_097]|uniref:FHA domain-containing protein n=1 Tax=Oscillatoriales cyanobacterium SpSt-418 TaxID=2282169 RepID=A0A7C3KC29_9CYAN|nr:FHA domain-containing protein [Leptolyngbyaceae cyanobacterium M33_DOE_097]
MIVCPNCNHQNPEGAVQCEACYTPLPQMTTCPNCGASVQTDASFCGQCGFSLKVSAAPAAGGFGSSPVPSPDMPDLIAPDPLVLPEPFLSELPPVVTPPNAAPVTPAQPSAASSAEPPSATPPAREEGRTQLQKQVARLLHVQTNVVIELPPNLSVIHIGKPNERIPPDIDVSGFPDSEIVSRVHADIRAEADAFYIEDVGSSNGTYVNNIPLPMGNRHRLRPGDRIALGKGDKVSFLFQLG